jgi:pimeloyl-ACP methyl ester carboxylesterase
MSTDRPTPHYFQSRGNQRLAYYEIGSGRPLILIHGYFTNAFENWIHFGHAAAIAARGFRVIMPDLRGHGASASPHDVDAYPPDVLTGDGLALIEHLALDDYDLGGYSLGGRHALRLVARGATPKRLIVAGQGIDSIVTPSQRRTAGFFHRVLTQPGTFEPDSREARAERFLKKINGDRIALLHIAQVSVPTTAEQLAQIAIPTLVLIGDEDPRPARDLANAMPTAQYAEIPGNHTTVITNPDRLGTAMADFLDSTRTVL